MKQLLELLAEMINLKLIGNYALGGATALIRYFEPVQTQDIDVFIVLSNEENGLVNLSPIYSFLTLKGIEVKGEYFLVGTTPVQLLVPYNALIDEAVENAGVHKFMGCDVRIPSFEHLMAIMVQTGRAKDKARLSEIFEKTELFDSTTLNSILKTHNLEAKFERVKLWMNG